MKAEIDKQVNSGADVDILTSRIEVQNRIRAKHDLKTAYRTIVISREKYPKIEDRLENVVSDIAPI